MDVPTWLWPDFSLQPAAVGVSLWLCRLAMNGTCWMLEE
jgi:hypothetical protein